MFNKLKDTLKKFTTTITEQVKTREIKEKDLDDPLQELFFELIENDVAYPIAENIIEEVKNNLLGMRVEKGKRIENVLKEAMKKTIEKVMPEPDRNVIEEAKRKCSEKREPYIIIFMGVNGVGKTTSIAKVARLFQKNGMTPVIVAADTFRAGAQEQLEQHARRLGVPIIKAKYNSDPAAVTYDAIAFARKRNYCIVLIDTAGRMHTDKDLIGELRKIINIAKPDLKLLVVDSLTGNDAVEQARQYEDNIGIDGFILTKVDADVKGGTAISITGKTGKPIYFLGVGQDYDDLEKFKREWLIRKLFE